MQFWFLSQILSDRNLSYYFTQPRTIISPSLSAPLQLLSALHRLKHSVRERERMEEAAATEVVVVTPGEVLGKASQVRAGRGAYVAPHNNLVYASLTGFRRTLSPPPNSPDQVTNFLTNQLTNLSTALYPLGFNFK